ncbi:hypothetical protein LSUE1_G005149 [Lachnellula suecica]|uniref:Uncharacterized protein n=1 Tax=Lachnellula suecica TaxID=602035 RepID=A0A8T9CFX2_9HELO|nr:hypothetical protein LSUE1_G005149 [Lachnellula suecica]
MNTLSGYLDEAYMSWLRSSVSCCAPLQKQAPGSRGEFERPMRIEHHQPRLIPPPIPEPQERPSTRGSEWVSRSKSFASRASSRGSFSVRRKLNAYNGPRRPRIGAPSDFRHLENAMPRRNMGFRPLELSIYEPQNQLSPILPHFRPDDLAFPSDMKDLPRPPTAMTSSRSDSSLSFRIPRKAVRSSSRASSEWTAHFKPRPDSLSAQELLERLEDDLPKPPPPARLRANTEPPTYERIKSALRERFELEQRLRDIDEVIEERKSIYMSSRPTSRATSRPRSIYSESQEPMPTPPPLKASFAERVSTPPSDRRPKTAPPRNTVHIPARLKSFTEASATFSASPATSTTTSFPSPPPKSPLREFCELPPPPPLPLVLQAPHPLLRKKKSFSRVSNWLSRSSSISEHGRNISLDSVTNTPKLLKEREGFYQCVDLRTMSEENRRDSVSTVSTMESEVDADGDEETWTPESSPGREKRQGDMVRGSEDRSIELERMRSVRTFGTPPSRGKEMSTADQEESWRLQIPEKGYVPGRNSVGVAF